MVPQTDSVLPAEDAVLQAIVKKTIRAHMKQLGLTTLPDYFYPPPVTQASPPASSESTSMFQAAPRVLETLKARQSRSAPIKPLLSPRPAPAADYRFRPFSFGTTPDTASPAPAPMVTTPPALDYDEKQLKQGGLMVDLAGYKDLTRPPVASDDEAAVPPPTPALSITETEPEPMSTTVTPVYSGSSSGGYTPHPEVTEHDADFDIYAEYSSNVKTLVQLVNDLPEGVTKQTGAQIIRLTMEAMGISMETVLSDAQAVQSQLLDAVRGNIKKIEEYKTIIRKLESEIRFHQGKANELSEIIDLFILSNASPNMPRVDVTTEAGY